MKRLISRFMLTGRDQIKQQMDYILGFVSSIDISFIDGQFVVSSPYITECESTLDAAFYMLASKIMGPLSRVFNFPDTGILSQLGEILKNDPGKTIFISIEREVDSVIEEKIDLYQELVLSLGEIRERLEKEKNKEKRKQLFTDTQTKQQSVNELIQEINGNIEQIVSEGLNVNIYEHNDSINVSGTSLIQALQNFINEYNSVHLQSDSTDELTKKRKLKNRPPV